MISFIKQKLIAAVRGLLTGRVNEILRDEEFATPFVEFGDYQGGDCVVPVINMVKCERSEKERIVRLAAYSMSITIDLPQTFECEQHCYAIAAAVCMALNENPTLGGIADNAEVVMEKYVSPKLPQCGQGWGVVISVRITVERLVKNPLPCGFLT